MRTLVTIMAHKEAQDIFNRHFPLWFDLGHDMLIVYPKQSRVLIPSVKGKHTQNVMQQEIGAKGWSGIESIIRFRAILEHLHGMNYDRHVFFEYDALCLGELPVAFGDVAGNVFEDNGPDRGFQGTSYVHPPLMFTHKGIEAVVKQAVKMGLHDENAIWDRWLGLCLERAGITPTNFILNGIGDSRNTWEDSMLPTLKDSVRSGRKLLHGIKSEAALKTCLEAREFRKHIEAIEKYGGKTIWQD